MTGLSGGDKEAYVEFFSSDDYNDNVNASYKFTVYPNNSLITIYGNDIYKVGDTIEISFDTFNSTGDVTVYLNGKTVPYSGIGSHYDIDLTGLLEDNYILTVHLAGDQNYTG